MAVQRLSAPPFVVVVAADEPLAVLLLVLDVVMEVLDVLLLLDDGESVL